MTIQSFTSDKTYETTPEHCTCGDYLNRQSKVGGKCKHQKALIAACNTATIFALLRMKFDYRLNGDLDTRRCYYEMSIQGLN